MTLFAHDPLAPSAVVAFVAGVSKKRLRSWVDRGYVTPTARGHRESYLWDEDAASAVVAFAEKMRQRAERLGLPLK